MTDVKLPESEVKIKVSLCPDCKGWVRAAVLHMMDKKQKNSFGREVMRYNLDIKTIPLLEWREIKMEQCECEAEETNKS